MHWSFGGFFLMPLFWQSQSSSSLLLKTKNKNKLGTTNTVLKCSKSNRDFLFLEGKAGYTGLLGEGRWRPSDEPFLQTIAAQ